MENKRFARILPWVLAVWPDLDLRLARTLTWLMVALQRSKNFVLAEWARILPAPKQPRVPHPKHGLLHRIKRVWRWVSHPRLDPIELQLRAVPWLWKAMGRPRRWILLADWTKVTLRTIRGKRKTFHVFRVAVIWRFRAIPLVQVAYDPQKASESQNQVEERVLAALWRALPRGLEAVLVMDRGFDRASLFHWLQERGIPFVVRLRQGTYVHTEDGVFKLDKSLLTPGQVRVWRQARLREDGRVRLHVVGHWAPSPGTVVLPQGQRLHTWRQALVQERSKAPKTPPEPWFLATTLEDLDLAVLAYALRMWIEQSFRDSKTGLWRLESARVSTAHRLSLLLTVLTLTQIWLVMVFLTRARWVFAPRYRRELEAWKKLSVFRYLLAALERWEDRVLREPT